MNVKRAIAISVSVIIVIAVIILYRPIPLSNGFADGLQYAAEIQITYDKPFDSQREQVFDVENGTSEFEELQRIFSEYKYHSSFDTLFANGSEANGEVESFLLFYSDFDDEGINEYGYASFFSTENVISITSSTGNANGYYKIGYFGNTKMQEFANEIKAVLGIE